MSKHPNSLFLLRRLCAAQLLGLYGINSFRHTKDRHVRLRTIALGCACALVILMAVGYVVALSLGLCYLGLGDILPTYLSALISLLLLALGLFRTAPALFSRRGYEGLCALPLPTWVLVVSRLAVLYAEDMLLALLVLAPGMAVYFVLVGFALSGLAALVLGVLLLPVVPLCLSTLLGTLIYALSSRAKHKALAQTAGMLIVVLGVLLASLVLGTAAEDMTLEQWETLAASAGDKIAQLYPPAAWLGAAATVGSLVSFGLTLLLPAALIALSLPLLTRLFHPICRALAATSARHDYRLERLQSRSQVKTLLTREWKRYLSSGIYVSNTAIGPILATVAAGALLFTEVTDQLAALPLPLDLSPVIPLIWASMFCMMPPIAVSVTMEGRRMWVLQSLPVSAATVYDAKLLFNLTLMAPFYGLSQVFLLLSLRPRGLDVLWTVLLPALLALCTLTLALRADLALHRFDHDSDTRAVKQSASAGVGGFAGLVLALGCAGLLLLTPPAYTHLARAVLCVLLAMGAVLLRRACHRIELQTL